MHKRNRVHTYIFLYRERGREGRGADLGSAAGIVDGAGDEDPASATNQEGSVVVRDISAKRRRNEIPEHRHEQQQQRCTRLLLPLAHCAAPPLPFKLRNAQNREEWESQKHSLSLSLSVAYHTLPQQAVM